MTVLERHTIVWSGGQGLPGYTNLFFIQGLGTDHAGHVKSFADAIKSVVPDSVHLSGTGDGDLLDSANGDLVGVHSDTTQAYNWQGQGSSVYAAPAGACISWKTAGINRAHKVRGRTFVVPMASSFFEDNGTLSLGGKNTVAGGSLILVGDGETGFCVWSRPINRVGGAAFSVIGASVRDVVAILTSRR